MPENSIENLKSQIEEISLDLAKSVDELDKIIEEKSVRAKQNAIKSQMEFLNQLRDSSLKMSTKQTDFLQKQQILTGMYQPHTMEVKDLEEETNHVVQVSQEQKNAVFEANLQKMNFSSEKQEEPVVKDTIEKTFEAESSIVSTAKNSAIAFEAEKILEKNLANYDLQAINQEELQENEEIVKKPSIEELNQVIKEIESENQENSINNDSSNKKTTSAKTPISKLEKKLKENIGEVKTDIEVSKSKSIKPGVKVKNKRKKKDPEWDQSRAYFKCLLGASALIGSLSVPIIGETLNHLPPKENVGVESEFSLDESAMETKSNVLREYQDEIFNKEIKYIYDAPGKTEAPYYYDWIDINLETKEKYEDPIVGFYLAYSSTKDWDKNNAESMRKFISKYNYIYQTNYKNLEDFLKKNNFQSLAELENYALSTLQEIEEGKSL